VLAEHALELAHRSVRTTLGAAGSAALALGIFALWFVLDPDPASVWQEFVLAENAGKMSSSMGYWQAALFGPLPHVDRSCWHTRPTAACWLCRCWAFVCWPCATPARCASRSD